MKVRIRLAIACVCCFVGAASAQVPWINVPMASGSAGQYACVTRPTYNQTIAIITCNPQAVAMFPPFVQTFLYAHEHGHVYQIVYNPQMFMSPYAEYDADCYAATWMMYNDRQSLMLAIQWFRQVLGPNGGDAIHGNGFQMAARAEQCAQSVDPTFTAKWEPPDTQTKAPMLVNGFLEDKPATSSPVTNYPKPKGMSKTSGTAFPTVPATAEPTACTAIEYLAESSHASFWEASNPSGSIVPNISKALEAECHVTGAMRRAVQCTQPKKVTPDLMSEAARCLATGEWEKSCEDKACNTAVYRHPGDGDEHLVVRITSNPSREVLEMTAPPLAPHSHDSKDYDSIK